MGYTEAGDPLVQVANGKYKDRIYLLHHEYYYGFYEQIISKEPKEFELFYNESKSLFEELNISDSENISTDNLLDILTHKDISEGLLFIAHDFTDFLNIYMQTRIFSGMVGN